MITSYVAIDLETTGLNAKLDKIIEIAAVKVIYGKICGQKSYLINPGIRIPQNVVELTGITDKMVENQPYIDAVADEIIDFIGDLPLLGHKIIFDYSFLKKMAVNHKRTFEKKGIDTLMMARILLPKEMSKRLEALCQYYNIETTSHRAMSDVLSTIELYGILCKEFEGAQCLDCMKELVYTAKKDEPIRKRQIEYLNKLITYHKIEMDASIEKMTRSEASRLTDRIIANYGRIPDGQ